MKSVLFIMFTELRLNKTKKFRGIDDFITPIFSLDNTCIKNTTGYNLFIDSDIVRK